MAECNVCYQLARGLYQLPGCACLVCPACYVAGDGWCPMHRVHPPAIAPVFHDAGMFGGPADDGSVANCGVCGASAERCMQHPACPHTPLTDVDDRSTLTLETFGQRQPTTFAQLASINGIVAHAHADCSVGDRWYWVEHRLWQPHRDTLLVRTGACTFSAISARNMVVEVRHIGGTERLLVLRSASVQMFACHAEPLSVRDASPSGDSNGADTGQRVPPCVAVQLVEAGVWSPHMLAHPALAHITKPDLNPWWRRVCRADVLGVAPATATSPAVNVGVVDTADGRRFVCTACGDTCTLLQFLERHVIPTDRIRASLTQLAAAAPPEPPPVRRAAPRAVPASSGTTYNDDVTVMRCSARAPDGVPLMTAFARYAVSLFDLNKKVTSVAVVSERERVRYIVLVHPGIPPGFGVAHARQRRASDALAFSRKTEAVTDHMVVNSVVTRVNTLLASAQAVERFPPDIVTKDRRFSYVDKGLMYACRR
jgi:hypothetical protein